MMMMMMMLMMMMMMMMVVMMMVTQMYQRGEHEAAFDVYSQCIEETKLLHALLVERGAGAEVNVKKQSDWQLEINRLNLFSNRAQAG